MTAPCARCGRPTDATICHPEARELADQLHTAAGHAEDAQAVITRQVRYGTSGPRAGEERPLPPNLAASRRLAAAAHTAETWLTQLGAEPEPWRVMAGPLCPPRRPGDEPRRGNRCTHTSCAAIRDRTPPSALAEALQHLARHTDQLRQLPDAGDAYTALERTCQDLARLVDRPADKDLVGMCDCGKVLYARDDQAFVKCPERTCQLVWNVDKSRDILRNALREKLFTASECARWAAFWTDRTQPQIRALITTWTRPDRARLAGRGWISNDDYTGAEDDDQPTGWALYLLGDVLDLLAQTPRRHREGAAA